MDDFNIFTIEEMNLMCIFNTETKALLLVDIKETIPHIYEPELTEIALNVIIKLDKITDEQFKLIEFDPLIDFEYDFELDKNYELEE